MSSAQEHVVVVLLVQFLHERFDQLLSDLRLGVGHLEDGFVKCGLVIAVELIDDLVSDHREGQHLHAAIGRYSGLMSRAHAHHVHANRLAQVDIAHGLKGGSSDRAVHAFVDRDAELVAGLLEELSQFLAVNARDREKAGSEAFIIGPDQRMVQGQKWKADVVFDEHEVADLVSLVDGSCSIGQNDELDTEQLENLDGHCAKSERITLERMESALHANDWQVTQGAKHKVALMAENCRAWKLGYLFVSNFLGI